MASLIQKHPRQFFSSIITGCHSYLMLFLFIAVVDGEGCSLQWLSCVALRLQLGELAQNKVCFCSSSGYSTSYIKNKQKTKPKEWQQQKTHSSAPPISMKHTKPPPHGNKCCSLLSDLESKVSKCNWMQYFKLLYALLIIPVLDSECFQCIIRLHLCARSSVWQKKMILTWVWIPGLCPLAGSLTMEWMLTMHLA